MKNQQFNVQGMGCQGCANAVNATLTNLTGVSHATIDFDRSQADVTFDETTVTIEQMQAAVADAGYTLSI